MKLIGGDESAFQTGVTIGPSRPTVKRGSCVPQYASAVSFTLQYAKTEYNTCNTIHRRPIPPHRYRSVAECSGFGGYLRCGVRPVGCWCPAQGPTTDGTHGTPFYRQRSGLDHGATSSV